MQGWLKQHVGAPFDTCWISVAFPATNFSNPADKVRHDKMVGLVEQMLSLNKKLAASKLDHEKNTLQRQIDATDRQIDELVYELYGLREEERRIVEGAQ